MFWLAALTPCRLRSSSSFWPSRAGPRAGPSTLRSASARRRRRGSPRCAARASPLHLSGLVGSSPFPRSLSSASGSAAVFATLRKRAAPPPGSHPARGPRPSASLFGTRGSPGSLLLDPRVDLRARGPVGPAVTSADARLCSPHGGTLAPSSSPPPGWGGTGGDAVRSWEAPCRPGAEGWQSRTWSCALAVPDALAVRYSNPIVLRPSWGKQVSSDKASPATHCVTLVSRNRGSPDRFESDWMHDTARCLGYPSDSMRAARERAPGDYLQSCRSSPTALVARPSPLWLIYRPVALLPIPWFICRPSGLALAPVAQLPSPLWLGSRPCGSTAVAPVAWLSPLWLNGGLSGVLAPVSDQTRPQLRCRRHRRAAGGGPELAGWRVSTGAPCTLFHLGG